MYLISDGCGLLTTAKPLYTRHWDILRVQWYAEVVSPKYRGHPFTSGLKVI